MGLKNCEREYKHHENVRHRSARVTIRSGPDYMTWRKRYLFIFFSSIIKEFQIKWKFVSYKCFQRESGVRKNPIKIQTWNYFCSKIKRFLHKFVEQNKKNIKVFNSITQISVRSVRHMLTVNRLTSTLYDVLKCNSFKFVESSVH